MHVKEILLHPSILIILCVPAIFSCKQNSPDRQDYKTLAVNVENNASLKAEEILGRIKEQVTCDWRDETVDTYKSGNPDVEITGIATTFLATLDVLQKAEAQGSWNSS